MKKLLLIVAVLLLSCTVAYSETARIALCWNSNSESDLAGYRVYMGNAPGMICPNTSPTNVPPSGAASVCLNLTLTGTVGQKWYYRVTAYDIALNESACSTEVSYTMTSTSTTTIPDTTPPGSPTNLRVTPIP